MKIIITHATKDKNGNVIKLESKVDHTSVENPFMTYEKNTSFARYKDDFISYIFTLQLGGNEIDLQTSAGTKVSIVNDKYLRTDENLIEKDLLDLNPCAIYPASSR